MAGAEEAACMICGLPETQADNAVLRCCGKSCIVVIHQGCYGVDRLQSSKWFCRRCEPHSMVRITKVKCCLCPSREGAFKRTTGPDEFCHVECALWNPEVHFADPVRLEPVVLSAELRKQLGSTLCSICHELNKPSRELASFGFTIPCAVSGCEKRMHVSCARKQNLLKRPLKEGRLDLAAQTGFRVCCLQHPKGTNNPAASTTGHRSSTASSTRTFNSAQSASTSVPAQVAANGHGATSGSSGVSLSRQATASKAVVSALAAAPASSSLAKRKELATPASPLLGPPRKRRIGSTDPSHTPYADNFQAEVTKLLDYQKRAVTQLALDSYQVAGGTQLSRMEQATRTQEKLQARLKGLAAENERLRATNALLISPLPPLLADAYDGDVASADGNTVDRLRDTLCAIFGITGGFSEHQATIFKDCVRMVVRLLWLCE